MAKCKHCGRVLDLYGTPAQVILRMRMHFRRGHEPSLAAEVDRVTKAWESLSEDDRARAVEALLRKHFVLPTS